MTAADAAWALYRADPARREEAAELALGIAGDRAAAPDDIAKAGTLLFAAGRVGEATRARDAALARGASPTLLAYLDTSCALAAGEGRAARRVLRAHLKAASDPLHPDHAWLAAEAGAPRLAFVAARRAELGVPASIGLGLRAVVRRSPRKTCGNALGLPR